MRDYASKSQASLSFLGWIYEFIGNWNLPSEILNKNKEKRKKAASKRITWLLKQLQIQIIIH